MNPKRKAAPPLSPPSAVPVTLSVQEVCRALGVSRSTFYRRHEMLRYTQPGGPGTPRRYFADDIKALLLLNTIVPEKPNATRSR